MIGAGGFGREVLDIVDALTAAGKSLNWTLLGVVDDAPSDDNLALLKKRGVEYVGTVDEFPSLGRDLSYVVGIGSPIARRRIVEKCTLVGVEAETLVHPAATLGYDVQVGTGSVVCAGARLTTNVRLGRHVHVNPNVTVGHDSIIGDFVSLNPAASVSGDCVIGDDTLIGVGGIVLNGLVVGRGAVVGGGACVVKDVPPSMVVKGIPAR